MGLDFIRKAAASYCKGLDRRRIELATPTLFTQELSSTPRAFVAKLCGGKRLVVGEKVGVRLIEHQVTACRGLDPVANFTSPPADLIEALAASGGEAWGVVQQLHEAAQVAEITVC